MTKALPEGHNRRRWTDAQVLCVIKAGPREWKGVCAEMGMSTGMGAHYRSVTSVLANRLRDENPDIPRPGRNQTGRFALAYR